MEKQDELRTVPSWKAHQMTGDRKGRGPVRHQELEITFRIVSNRGRKIIDLDYEDYH